MIVSTESNLRSFSCQRKLIQQNDNWNNVYKNVAERNLNICKRESVGGTLKMLDYCFMTMTRCKELINNHLEIRVNSNNSNRVRFTLILRKNHIATKSNCIDVLEIFWSAFVSSDPSNNPILVLQQKKKRLSGKKNKYFFFLWFENLRNTQTSNGGDKK